MWSTFLYPPNWKLQKAKEYLQEKLGSDYYELHRQKQPLTSPPSLTGLDH